MRPADDCKPELSKTSTRASGAYRVWPSLRPIRPDAPPGSRRRGALRFAARAGPGALSAPRLAVRLTSGASSCTTEGPTSWTPCRPPRPHSPSSREGRRFPRPEVPSAGKANHVSSRAAPRPLRAGASFFGAPSPENPKAPSSTARQRPAATERLCLDRSATCRFLQAARSTSTTRERPNLARFAAFSASKRRSTREQRATGHPEPGWRLESACLVGRRCRPASMRCEAPRPTGARRALTCHRPSECRRR